MGALTSKTQQDLKLYLQRDYDITHYPSITHLSSKKTAIVHQITTDSTEQAHRIRTDVNLYKHLKCESISNILEYIPLESAKICSDQEFHYIVEEDMQKYNLKEEFYARKYYKEKFSDNQILNIIKAFLCGLNVYHTHFHRSFNSLIKIDALTVDEKRANHLRLTDPLLMQENKVTLNSLADISDDDSQSQSNLRIIALNEDHNTIREAPQKSQIKKTKFNEKKVELNELLADIYLVGIVVLQIHRMKLFQKTQKHSILPAEINAIQNRELQKIVATMTATNPDERGKVFEMIKISPQESYHLERNFKNGHQNPVQTAILPTNVGTEKQPYFPSQQDGFFKKETSFSFGTSPTPVPLVFPVKNNEYVEHQGSFGVLNLDRQKYGSVSNMSTDRTIQPIPTVRPVLNGGFSNNKPVVSFNGGSGKHVSSHSVPGFGSSFSSNPQNTFSQNYISTGNNSGYKASGLLENRTNSFFIQEDSKRQVKESEYSPYKKQQDMSPIIGKDSILQESGYKKIFDKYSHVNYEQNPSQSNGNFGESRRMEEEMNRLLKESSQRTIENNNNNNNRNRGVNNNNGYGLVNRQMLEIHSPIDALENHVQMTFAMRENAARQEMAEHNGEVPLYKPNKEVEEILKRLGIGSLLYGNNNNNENGTNNQDSIKGERQRSTLKSIETDTDQFNEPNNVFVHKGAYNIAVQNSKNSIKQTVSEQKIRAKQDEVYEQQQDDIHDRQTTPIRPAQKNKYNSTIVEVGDEDSQYSSSGVRNQDTPIDLSNHQYVVEEYETGSKYEGYKLNGQRDGHGKFFYQDGGYYEGQWKNNKMDGWGKLFYQGGKLAYQGNWCQDQFHGFGKVYNDNPIHLECGFDFTNFDLLEDYWEYYEGMLVKDTKQGRGKIKLTNGEVFEGDFHNDRIQGFGKFFMRENSMIEGIWRDSKLIKIISS